MSIQLNLQSAAIVCREIAVEHAPILYAERSEPEEEADSGWQFLCGKPTEDWKAAQVWALQEVLAYDPSLCPFLGLPAGTALSRVAANGKWMICGAA